MSLFPAYASQNDGKDNPASEGSVSLSWLQNESCPPEVGQIPLPLERMPADKEDAEGQQSQEELSQVAKKKKDKKKKKKSSNKKRKKKKHHSSSGSSSSSRSGSRSPSTNGCWTRSPNVKGSRSRSGSVPKEERRALKKKWRQKSASKSKSRSRSKSRTSSGSDLEEREKSSLQARARSSTRTKTRRSRSHSRRRDLQSRSRSRSTSRRRGNPQNRSRKRSRSQSRSRSLSRRRSRSRSLSRRRSRSRSLSRRRSRSQSKSQRRSRPSSRSRRRSKSRSPSKRKSRSRSRGKSCRSSRVDSKRKGSSEAKTSSQVIVSGSKSVFLEDLHGLVKPEDAFHIETSGDKNNLIFSTTHYTQVARYKIKSKRVLGCAFSRGDSLGIRKKKPRYFKRAAQKALYCNAELVRTLPLKFPEAVPSGGDGYIPLELTYAEASGIKSEKSNANQPRHDTELFYLDLDSDEDEKSEEAEYAFWQRKLKEYNEKLGKEPGNTSLWLEFVRFQDKSYSHLFSNEDDRKGEKKKKLSLKALAERKISILDSAIKKNPRALDLQFERLTIGQDIWDDKKIKQEWGSLIFNFPNKLEVWHWYLAFTQTHFTSFNLASVVTTFSKCSERLQQIRSGVFMAHAPPELGKCLVDIAVQLAHVWKQAGYIERSIALFQALIELNLFAPAHARSKNIPLEARLALFEPFWDSRAPRLGEENAMGWAEVMERRQQIEFPEVVLGGTHDEEDDILGNGGTTSELWLALESSRERRHWLPWEQDPEDCEDPERMVSFEDISNHLFTLESTEENFYLLLQFLKFLGVPYAHRLLSQWRTASKKSVKSEKNKVSNIFKPLTLENLLDDALFGRTAKLEDVLIGGREGILNFPDIGPTLAGSASGAYYTFVCEVLQQVSKVIEQPYKIHLNILYMKLLALKFMTMKSHCTSNLASFSKELKKKAKSILKLEEFRSCLPIYQEYGKLEEIMEHYDDSENVYTTALTIGTAAGKALDVNNPNLREVMELYTSYVELELKMEGQKVSESHSNNIVCSLSSLILDGKFAVKSGSPASGSVILKAKKHLQEMQESSLRSVSEDTCDRERDVKLLLAAKLTSLLALLQLLTVGFRSGCSIYETSIKKVKEGFHHPVSHKLEDITLPGESHPTVKLESQKSSTNKPYLLESIIEEFLWFVEVSSFLDHLVRGEQMSPVQMRSVLALAVEIAPENPKFLLHFCLSQTWRDLLGGGETPTQNNSSILVSVSRILPHIQRTITLVANTDEGLLSSGHRLEKVLERGVSRLPGRHCPLLWRIYLALVATMRPSGLKELVYRAISSCPGNKSVYLDCIRLVPDMLKEIVTLFGEKGIRVRLPLEELQVLTETELDLEV